MKILHVITSLYTGGAEKLMVDLLPRLRAAGYEVELCIFDGTRTPFYEQLAAQGVKIYDFGVGNPVYSPKNILRLRRLMRNYDVIHTHNTAPQLFAAIANIGMCRRLITTEHGGSNRRRKYKLLSLSDRLMYSRYDRVICISEKCEEGLRNFIHSDSDRIITINNGVDVQKYAGADPSGDLEQLASGSRKVMMVAGFRWEKDQPTVLRALALLPGNFHLFFVGDGPRRGELEALAAELGIAERVHFMGIRSDVAELLRAADYVVMSSHFEGLSLSSVEGMSVGKAFLASDVDGLREVVKGYGLLFEHENPQDLASVILSLEGDAEMYKEVARRCFERAKEFDICRMVEGYSMVYSL